MEEQMNIPYLVYESAMSRSERMIKRLFVALIVSIIAIFATNACWAWLWNQYDYESVNLETGEYGDANFIGNDGEIYNGIDSGYAH